MNRATVTPLDIDPQPTLLALESAIPPKALAAVDEIDLEDLRAAVSDMVGRIAIIESHYNGIDFVGLGVPHYPGEGVVGAAMYATVMRPAGYRFMTAGLVGPKGEVATRIPTSHRQIGFGRDGGLDWAKWVGGNGVSMAVGSCEEDSIGDAAKGATPLPPERINAIVGRSLEHLALWGLRSLPKGQAARIASKFASDAAASLGQAVSASESRVAARLVELLPEDDLAAFAAKWPSAPLGLWNALRAAPEEGAAADYLKYREQFLEASPAFQGALGRTYAPCPVTLELKMAIDRGQSPMAVFAGHVPGLRKSVWKNVLKMDLTGIEPIIDCTAVAGVLRAANNAPSTLPIKTRADLDSAVAISRGLSAIERHASRLGVDYEGLVGTAFARGWAEGARALVEASAPAALDHATPEVIYGFADVALRSIDEMSAWAVEWHEQATAAGLKLDCSSIDFARALFSATSLTGLAGRLHAWEAVKGATEMPMTDEEKALLQLPEGAEWTPLTQGQIVVDGFTFTELKNRTRMVQESDVMHHCLGSWYGERAYKQGHRPFCVTKGDQAQFEGGGPKTRATANFTVSAEGDVQLEQVKAVRNAAVSPELASAVKTFLAGIRSGAIQGNTQCYSADMQRLTILGEQGNARDRRRHKAELVNRAFTPLLPPEARAAGVTAVDYVSSENFRSALTEARGAITAAALAAAAKSAAPAALSFGA